MQAKFFNPENVPQWKIEVQSILARFVHDTHQCGYNLRCFAVFGNRDISIQTEIADLAVQFDRMQGAIAFAEIAVLASHEDALELTKKALEIYPESAEGHMVYDTYHRVRAEESVAAARL